MTNTCKFCGVAEGALDRRGAAAHINRDGLCNSCHQLMRVIKEGRPCSLDDRVWFGKTCRLNMSLGRFVPAAQRRRLKAARPWQCKRCGSFRETFRDENYRNYCITCAANIRRERHMPLKGDKQTRSDKGGKHRKPNTI